MKKIIWLKQWKSHNDWRNCNLMKNSEKVCTDIAKIIEQWKVKKKGGDGD